MPSNLRACIDEVLAGTKTATLAQRVERLMAKYRSGEVPATPILSSPDDVLAYAAYRMPATYAVARAVLQQVRNVVPDSSPRSLLDLGAGTGAVGWAASQVWPGLTDMHLLEQSETAIALGKRLMQHCESSALRSASWQSWRLSSNNDVVATADVGVAAYVLGELTAQQQAVLLATLMAAAHTVVLIEPGTPAGFERIVNARGTLIASGFAVLAPCPHDVLCPLSARGDWCHFAERLDRSRIHRAIKDGELGYEDEKYSYVVASRTIGDRPGARIVRHPQLRKGLVSLQLCTAAGEIAERRVAKSQGESYKAARRARWGEPWGESWPSSRPSPRP